MYAIAIALFVAIVTIVPNLLEWYPNWIKEMTTPAFFKNMPYLPMWAGWGLVIFATGFFIYASIRETRIQKRKRAGENTARNDLNDIRDRLNDLKDNCKDVKSRLDTLEKFHK